ncbi:GTP cyclohydrolase I [Rhodanobacter sp. AS-Z3]|uniref:GTP cyclohydrolase I n=1 Tax=Rhodanobacter sp. AS-Z3 TaxID=3031330 RepID=UPI00247891DC|nr:GTP cyclohydrolase I [Rhodanobacter sp. AS-Z3]WEN15628.1 GTP cyclohydrolase I [Rhodanobacter sp. AS-Z3]
MLDSDPSVDQLAGALPPAGEIPHPSRAEAEAAVRTLIRWAGDNPAREGLLATPARVVRAYEEWFAGYRQDAAGLLSRTFGEVAGYDEAVILRDIPLQSTCEHHMAAINGVVHIAYLPNERVVGISKLARLVEALGRRLQIQERLTAEIADTLTEVLHPRGVAVVVEASHACLSSRGVRLHGVSMQTRRLLGEFAPGTPRQEILSALLGRPGNLG